MEVELQESMTNIKDIFKDLQGELESVLAMYNNLLHKINAMHVDIDKMKKEKPKKRVKKTVTE